MSEEKTLSKRNDDQNLTGPAATNSLSSKDTGGKSGDETVTANDRNEESKPTALSVVATKNEVSLGSPDSVGMYRETNDRYASVGQENDIESSAMNNHCNSDVGDQQEMDSMIAAAIEASRSESSAMNGHRNSDTGDEQEMDSMIAAAIEASRSEVVPGAFREGYMGDEEDSTTVFENLTQSSNTNPVQQEEPYMAVAKVVVEPELVAATLQESTNLQEGDSKHESAPHNQAWIPGRYTLRLLLLGALVVVGLVTAIVVSRNRRLEAATNVGGPMDLTSTPTTTTAPTYPETFELLGNFTDAEEGIKPDLYSLKVSVSRSLVAFDLTFMDSGITDPYTFLIDMKADTGNLDRLEMSNNGEWALSRLEPIEEVISGTYILVGGDDKRKNARIEVPRSHLQDLFSKEVSVYCEMSDDRMPDSNASSAYYTLKETSTGILVAVSDPVNDVEGYPDFTYMTVEASDNEVDFILSFFGDEAEMDVTISMDSPPGIGPHDLLTVVGDSGSWAKRRRVLVSGNGQRQLQDDELDSVEVSYHEYGLEITFPRRRIPDLMTRLISAYSDKSKDRLPDSGEILLVDEILRVNQTH